METLKNFWTNNKGTITTVFITIAATAVTMWSLLKWKKKIR